MDSAELAEKDAGRVSDQPADPPATDPPATVAPAETVTQLPAATLQLQLEKQQKRQARDKLQGSKLHRDLDARNALKLTISQELNKLDSLETRETALKAIRACLEVNVNREALKLFLSLLTSPKTQSAKGRCAELRVIIMLLQLFKSLLLESSGAGLHRIYSLVLAFFSDRSREVQEGVGECMCAVYECAQGLPGSPSSQFILDPLTTILTSGTELHAQQTAAVTLRLWICGLSKDQTPLVLDAAKKVTALFLKLRPGYPDLISTLGYLLQHFGIEFMIEDLLLVVRKLLAYFGAERQNGHFGEREACKLLGEIYRKLGTTVSTLGEIKQEVLSKLKAAKSHRVAEVQREAAAAYLLWTSDKPPALTVPPVKPSREPVTRLRTMRDLLKQRKAEELSSPPPPEDQWGVYKPKFLTRGSGRFVPKLGYGNPDLESALKTRPSIKDFIRSRGKSSKHGIEVYAKSPTEASRIVPRRGFSESPEGDFHPDVQGEEGSEGEARDGEVKDDEETEEVKEMGESGETPMQAFQVDAPVVSTEAGNPNAWNRMKAAGKKPVEPTDTPQSSASQSHRSSASILQRAVGKSKAMNSLLKLKGKHEAPSEDPQSHDSEAAEVPKYDTSAIFRAFGKSIVQKMSSRSVEEITSPKSTLGEVQQSAPATLDRGALQFLSPLVSARLKPAAKEPEPPKRSFASIIGKLKPVSKPPDPEPAAQPPSSRFFTNLVASKLPRRSQETANSSSQAADPQDPAEDPENSALDPENPAQEPENSVHEEENSSKVSETDENLKEILKWLGNAVLECTDAVDRQCEEIARLLDNMSDKISDCEAKVATRRRLIRAKNAAPPKYKSHIHPPVPLVPKQRIEKQDSDAQTRPPMLDQEMQTVPLELYKTQSEKPEIDPLSRVWMQTLADVGKKRVQNAYRRVLRTGDDVYLLRLMATTGPAVGVLSTYTLGTLLGRLSQLLAQSFIPALALDWIEGSVQGGVFFELGKEDQQSLLETVQVMSEEDTEDGWRARNLFEYLTSE